MALVSYEDNLCPCGCGFPKARTWDDEADGWYTTQETLCYARAALERWERSHGTNRPGPGVMAFVVDERDNVTPS